MKILNMIVLMLCGQLAFAQTDLQSLQASLEKDYNLAGQVELIEIGKELPINVPAEKSDSSAWHTAKAQTIELYVLWYEKMFDNGYELNKKAFLLGDYSRPPKDTSGAFIVEEEDQKERRLTNLLKTNNKKYAISTFLIAEQRLKLFIKNTYKPMRKKHFKEDLLAIEGSHDETVKKIVDNLLGTHSYFTVYEVKAKKQVEESEETIMVKN